MDSSWLDSYLDIWTRHAEAGGDAGTALIDHVRSPRFFSLEAPDELPW